MLQLLLVAFRKEWLMQEIHVNVVQLKFLQTKVDRLMDADVIVNVMMNLGGNEQLIAGDAGLLDCFADLDFRVVHFGIVEMLVASLYSSLDSIDCGLNLLALCFIMCCAAAEANLDRSDKIRVGIQELTIGIKLPSGSLRSGMVVSSFAILRETILLVYYAVLDSEKVEHSQPEVGSIHVGMRC
jgi:hypothetical protein